ncbi:IS21-like element helper ATPase IstB [Burkholderia sp. MSMB1552]|uniref:IS21-like element helper ATPase IstB n=1 Tax=Burkholderia sp. MSMB1552 TaxID=1636424 RepID=UPI003FA4A891
MADRIQEEANSHDWNPRYGPAGPPFYEQAQTSHSGSRRGDGRHERPHGAANRARPPFAVAETGAHLAHPSRSVRRRLGDPTKTLDSFDFGMVPIVSKAHVMALATGDSWLEKGATILLFGPPGGGKTHLGSGIGHALINAGYRVLFTRTSVLVQKLQAARQSLQLPSMLGKLDRFDLIILDDLSYVRKDQAETSVLFELIAERYERRSLLITANQPFSGWNDVFPDPSMTVAAIDRLVHHSTIFELNVESYRRRSASDNKRTRRRQLPDTEPEETTTMAT